MKTTGHARRPLKAWWGRCAFCDETPAGKCTAPNCGADLCPTHNLAGRCPDHAELAERKCPNCGEPGKFIRTRYFNGQFGHVWTCKNEACKNFHLYWHSDHDRAQLNLL